MTTTRIDKVLIANRGEIAVRVARTCRDMGIATVAVFSDADDRAPHVRQADEAIRIGPAPAATSYLAIDRIVSAARTTGADAIHPGYGFLAENAAFARACEAAGLVFIGPTAEVIERLGSKRESKRIAVDAGVPVIPGDMSTGGTDAGRDPAVLSAAAHEIGFPVLVKASAGGGGKGMRIVRDPDELDAAIASAMRQARSAFGDDALLIEKYIDRPRHVEIQILGDCHGRVIHLHERECSIQRRHQKIIEETPSPLVDDDLRQRMGAAAVALGRAVGYRGAGTVEFIVDPDRYFYFLEVNTRLQVEHPITECITGVDLVREQIRIARGEPLSVPASDSATDHGVPRSGAAIECRIYAEDDAFLPASGVLVDWHLPRAIAESPGVRIDSGVRSGQTIGIHYDPMLAKVICHAATRDEAIDKMRHLLRHLSVQGVACNRAILLRVLEHERFRQGDYTTHFIDQHRDELLGPGDPERARRQLRDAAIAAALAGHEARRAERQILPGLEPGFRNSRFGDERVDYVADEASGGQTVRCEYHNLGAGKLAVRAFLPDAAPGPAPDAAPETAPDAAPGPDRGAELAAQQVEVIEWAPPSLTLEDRSGWRRRYRVIAAGDAVHVQVDGVAVTLREQPRFPAPEKAGAAGSLVAPMPGNVLRVLVSPGQEIAAGDPVAILEAMKMEHTVSAPHDGVVTEVAVAEGDQVAAEALIAVVEPAT